MSDFYKSDVGFLQVGCRILTSRMSDFYKSDVECRSFKVGCRMAPISFRSRAMGNETFYGDGLSFICFYFPFNKSECPLSVVH